ncbi:MAG: hypothetical protein M1812_007079 [Candelaria pacifica]|nr:MAG: hypothetical protein M1812_007079 [Candelaria pacifica]
MRPIWSASLLATLAAATPFVTNKATSISYQGTSGDDVDQFQGISFAEDTSGANRFAPPKPYLPPHGTVVQATSRGAACPQATKGVVPPMSDVDKQSEDCLNLRIARPASISKQHKPLPVMIYIYGGGAILGDAYDGYFNPVGLVQQSVANGQPVIYVAANYRIGVFGFAAAAALRDAKSENIGLRDQYVALEWVKNNIAAFGGDPDNVTLFGQSFGGISVGLQMVAYGGEREALFHKAIMTSGAISSDRSGKSVVKNTAAVAEGLKCTTAGGIVDDAVLACLREAPLADLFEVQYGVATRAKPSFGFAAFTAVIDGDILPYQPDKLLQEGRFLKNIPLLGTWTADDGSLSADSGTTDDSQVVDTFAAYLRNASTAITSKILSLYPASDFESQASASRFGGSAQYFRAARIVRDIDPVCPLLETSRLVHHYGSKAVYLAELNATRLTPYWDAWSSPFGVSHLSDVPYFFKEAIVPPGDNSPAALELSAHYSGSFSAFANTGSPLKKRQTTFLDWPVAYSSDSEELTVLVIGGPYGTGPVALGSSNSAHNAEQHNQVAMGIPHGVCPAVSRRGSDLIHARTAALEQEKLVERCAYINSLTIGT